MNGGQRAAPGSSAGPRHGARLTTRPSSFSASAFGLRTQRPRLRDALLYVETFGFAVFPVYEVMAGGTCACPASSDTRDPGTGICENAGKHPRTWNGHHGASCDPVLTLRRWMAEPESHIGIATGSVSGNLLVLDEDPRNGGDLALGALEARFGPLPRTPKVITGGGGGHYYFRSETPLRGRKLVLDGARLEGLDVKGDGGFVVAPRSGHASGGVYLWDRTAHLADIPLASVPEWLVAQLAPPTSQPMPSGPVLDGILGRAFHAVGWLGRRIGEGKAAARCPWESAHTCGTRFDGSTVVFGPLLAGGRGWFHCSHSHCLGRRQDEVLEALPGGRP